MSARDVATLRAATRPIARRARDLPWSGERPWRPSTHIGLESELPIVDLHDLSVRLGLAVVEIVTDALPSLDAGAVVLITGRGRHTPGKSTLRDAVTGALRARCAAEGWWLRLPGPGRCLVVAEPARAPAAATGRLGPGFWLVLGGFALATTATSRVVGAALGLVALAGLVRALWTRAHSR